MPTTLATRAGHTERPPTGSIIYDIELNNAEIIKTVFRGSQSKTKAFEKAECTFLVHEHFEKAFNTALATQIGF